MQYNPPTGGAANDPYVGKNVAAGIQGSKVPPGAAEFPQREIVALITDAGMAPTNSDLAQMSQAVRSGKLNYLLDTGTADALLVSPARPYADVGAGTAITVLKINAANATTTPTITISGLTLPMVKANGSALAAGDLAAASIITGRSDGTRFRVSGIQRSDVAASVPPVADAQIWHTGTAGGTANAITTTLSPVPSANSSGFFIALQVAATNTGAATLDWRNGTPVPIVDNATGSALIGNALPTGEAQFFFDGTSARLMNPIASPSVAATKIWDYTFDGTSTSAICPIGSLAPGKSAFRITAFAPGSQSAYSYLGARISYDGSTFLSSNTGYATYVNGTISSGGFNSNTLGLPCGWYSGGGNGYSTCRSLFFAGSATATASLNGDYQIRSTSTNFPGNRDMGVFMGNAQTPVGPTLAIQFLGTGSYATANGSLIAAGTRIIVEVING